MLMKLRVTRIQEASSPLWRMMVVSMLKISGSSVGLGNGNWLCGDLGPFRLYTRALTAEEAREAYQRKW